MSIATMLGSRAGWAAIGAALAVSVGAVGAATILAAPSSAPSALVPITPCRLIDTRAGADNVGPRATPLGAGETFVATAWGSNGNCAIPGTATALSLNVTSLNGTAPSFLTVFPADVALPSASSLNWQPGQSATPNAVTAPLSADGKLALFNANGSVDVIVDVVGYFQPLPESGGQSPTPSPYQFTGSAFISPTTNKYYALGEFGGGFNTSTAELAAASWLAPDACVLSGRVEVIGGATAGQFSLRLVAVDDAGQVVHQSGSINYNTGVASGAERSFPGFNVAAGERVVLASVVLGGLTTVAADTTAYYDLTCQ